MADCFTQFFVWIIKISLPFLELKVNVGYVIGVVSCFIVIMVGIVIYLEIVLLNFCGFEVNTRKYIMLREVDNNQNIIKDFKEISISEINIDKL